MSKINTNEIMQGDIFSENSHYIFLNKDANGNFSMKHVESGKNIVLDPQYVAELLKTANIFDKSIEVGKEDKLWTQNQIDNVVFAEGTTKPLVGDVRVPGIRTIFENIHSEQVFMVSYKKADSNKTKKDLAAEKQAQIDFATGLIDKAKKNKKSTADAYKEALNHIQNNPIKDYIEGEDRVLRGFKIQYTSRDGRYDCHDMDITNGSPIRPVNINTINWLIYDGIKYVVK